MGYGMLLAVGANDQTTFDQLNAYRLEMLKASSTADKSLMPWAIYASKACPPTADGGDKNSATDGDIDAAMALLQAEHRWGGGTYKTQATTTLASVMALEVSGSGTSIRLDPGNQEADQRDYVAYYTPAYFAVFAAVTGDAKWTDLTNAYYTRLLANQCASNGQIYDDFQFPSGECKFWWDSCRVPWRVSLDYAWHQDTRAKQFLDKLEGFVGSDPSAISDQKNSAFAGGAALSAISNDDGARMQELCNAWASASGLDDSPYFQKTLRLLYMMVAGGMFVRPG
jgi:endo-1,4-beta-D-glucanase Y